MVRSCLFIDGPIDTFEAPFFSISAAEIVSIDPQCRALLETTHRASENGTVFQNNNNLFSNVADMITAGIPLAKVSNSNTTVYTGSLSDDFKAFSSKDMEQGSRYNLVGLPSLLKSSMRFDAFP